MGSKILTHSFLSIALFAPSLLHWLFTNQSATVMKFLRLHFLQEMQKANVYPSELLNVWILCPRVFWGFLCLPYFMYSAFPLKPGRYCRVQNSYKWIWIISFQAASQSLFHIGVKTLNVDISNVNKSWKKIDGKFRTF